MKNVLRIAKTELYLLFYSPIAWFLLIAFTLQMGISYFDRLQELAGFQEMGGFYLNELRDLTFHLFSENVFLNAMSKLYLYIPLLTMGLLSRETSSGTIKLLYSSPVTPVQIVIGKYISVVIFSVLLMMILSFIMIAGMYNIQYADAGILWSGALGFFLVVCVYASIGLFMSGLTNYQVVAMIATLLVIGLLSYIGKIWQGIEIVRDITYYLSIAGRTEHMMEGLITTKDIFYFVAITYMFLGFTYLKIRDGMKSQTVTKKMARYAFVLITGITFGFTTSRPAITAYWDISANKRNTISPALQAITRQLNSSRLEVFTYVNALETHINMGSPEYINRTITVLWDNYLRFKPDIDFNFIYYYDSVVAFEGPSIGLDPNKSLKEQAERMADAVGMNFNDFKSPEEIKKIVDLHPELNRYVMQLKYKGRSTFLRIFEDVMVIPGEPEVGAAFKRLLEPQIPKIYYITGHNERNLFKSGDKEYKRIFNEKPFRSSLLNKGFDTDTLNLDQSTIPEDAGILVIADPRIEFTAKELSKLHQYISGGGNLLIAGEPDRRDLLNVIAGPLGVQFSEGMLAQPSKDLTPDIIKPAYTPFAASLSSSLAGMPEMGIKPLMRGSAALDFLHPAGFTMQPLLQTDSQNTWLKKEKMVIDSAQVIFDSLAGDRRNVFTTAMAISRKIHGKEQKIVVAGDADFLSNEYMDEFAYPGNVYLEEGIFSWLCDGKFPIDAPITPPGDNRLTISLEQADMLRIPFVWILPVVMGLTGIIVLIRRKRK